jgi:hypothetical protein
MRFHAETHFLLPECENFTNFKELRKTVCPID